MKNKAYKFRIYPNKEQQEKIIRNFGCSRFVYNFFLDLRINLYDDEKKSLSYKDCSKLLTGLKDDFPWLRDADSTCLQTSLRDLDTAYKNFFRDKSIGFPKFKSKRHRQSYRMVNNHDSVRIEGNRVILPKLGAIKCRVSREVEGRILHATVSMNPSGRFYVSICCTDVNIETLPETGKSIGLDLGITSLATDSNGIRYDNNKYLEQSLKKLAKLQRQLSRKTKGSRNYEKARIRVAKLQEHISNQRRDTINKFTTEIVRNYDVICIEDLSAKEMLKNKHLSRKVADASFYEIRRELEYKAEWYGREVKVTGRYFPSSQKCSECGYVNEAIKNLAVRTWICPKCGRQHDRDINAAVNILNEGLRIKQSP